MRGVRGATTAAANDAESILSATEGLLRAMMAANGLAPEDLAAAWFTVTSDLDAAFPAQAARKLPGWQFTPLMDACEIPVPGSLARCIRVLLLWNTDRTQSEIVHIYQNGAQALRPDLAKGS